MENKNINALILDMDGVLWKAYQEIVDLKSTFQEINRMGLKYAFATNNSTKHISSYIEKISGFNVPVSEEQIYTSSIATAQELSRRYPGGGNIFVVGEDDLDKTLADYGFMQSKEDIIAVVVGLDFHLDYEELAIASSLVRNGALFIGTNPDLSFPVPGDFYPGAGSILALIEAASGVKPEIIGKPMKTMFEQALNYLGTKPEETLVIGDRLGTDILGGQNAGCKTALVLSGVSTLEESEKWTPQPDYIAEDLEKLVKIISNGK